MMIRIAAVLSLLAALFAAPVFAVQPDEILDDVALEERARDISKDLRCLVCRNESIDDSNADLARDLRVLVRERLVAGDSDTQTVAFIVDRYGEYVLLKPTISGSNWILWAAGPFMLLIGFAGAVSYLRRRGSAPETVIAALSDDEAKRLDKIMQD
ncbi:MAG: cytochrome c-type biogenesis protein CcmH [Rhodobacterales bacterium]|nr:cytochrome c-type biogenesis protein CcmH [Rhodobacterales bacterium]